MGRLTHSYSGFLRSMQISQNILFVFVEGTTDRYFYSKIVEIELSNKSLPNVVVMSSELGNGGGKKALLAFHDYLRKKRALITNLNGKITVSIFYLDKDLDDFLRRKKRSAHVVYTEHYEHENYLFLYGNLCDTAACSLSQPVGSLRQHMNDARAWRVNAADSWKDWVKVCFFSIASKLHADRYYSRPKSQINDPTTNHIDNRKLQQHLANLKAKSQLNKRDFDKWYGKISDRIDKLYKQEKHDLVFKGKWYVVLLIHEFRTIANPSNHLEDLIIKNLTASINYGEAWTNHFRIPIRNLATQAGI